MSCSARRAGTCRGKDHRHRVASTAGHSSLGVERRPLHADGGASCRRLAGDVRDVEHARTAVTAMGEKEAALRFDRLRALLRAQPNIQRDARQRTHDDRRRRAEASSAGYVSTMSCPSACAMRSPMPSLPVAGTESPPVASTTRSHAMVPPDVSTANPRAARDTLVTVVPNCSPHPWRPRTSPARRARRGRDSIAETACRIPLRAPAECPGRLRRRRAVRAAATIAASPAADAAANP